MNSELGLAAFFGNFNVFNADGIYDRDSPSPDWRGSSCGSALSLPARPLAFPARACSFSIASRAEIRSGAMQERSQVSRSQGSVASWTTTGIARSRRFDRQGAVGVALRVDATPPADGAEQRSRLAVQHGSENSPRVRSAGQSRCCAWVFETISSDTVTSIFST